MRVSDVVAAAEPERQRFNTDGSRVDAWHMLVTALRKRKTMTVGDCVISTEPHPTTSSPSFASIIVTCAGVSRTFFLHHYPSSDAAVRFIKSDGHPAQLAGMAGYKSPESLLKRILTYKPGTATAAAEPAALLDYTVKPVDVKVEMYGLHAHVRRLTFDIAGKMYHTLGVTVTNGVQSRKYVVSRTVSAERRAHTYAIRREAGQDADVFVTALEDNAFRDLRSFLLAVVQACVKNAKRLKGMQPATAAAEQESGPDQVTVRNWIALVRSLRRKSIVVDNCTISSEVHGIKSPMLWSIECEHDGLLRMFWLHQSSVDGSMHVRYTGHRTTRVLNVETPAGGYRRPQDILAIILRYKPVKDQAADATAAAEKESELVQATKRSWTALVHALQRKRVVVNDCTISSQTHGVTNPLFFSIDCKHDGLTRQFWLCTNVDGSMFVRGTEYPRHESRVTLDVETPSGGYRRPQDIITVILRNKPTAGATAAAEPTAELSPELRTCESWVKLGKALQRNSIRTHDCLFSMDTNMAPLRNNIICNHAGTARKFRLFFRVRQGGHEVSIKYTEYQGRFPYEIRLPTPEGGYQRPNDVLEALLQHRPQPKPQPKAEAAVVTASAENDAVDGRSSAQAFETLWHNLETPRRLRVGSHKVTVMRVKSYNIQVSVDDKTVTFTPLFEEQDRVGIVAITNRDIRRGDYKSVGPRKILDPVATVPQLLQQMIETVKHGI